MPCFWRKCSDKSYAHVHLKLQSVQLKYLIATRKFLFVLADEFRVTTLSVVSADEQRSDLVALTVL